MTRALGIDFGSLTHRIAFLETGEVLAPEFFRTSAVLSSHPMAKRLGPQNMPDLFSEIKANAEKLAGETVQEAVFSAPFFFSGSECSQLAGAAKTAGLRVLNWTGSSTDALLAWRMLTKKRGTFALASCGAGYFEICIADLKEESLQVKARRGAAWGGQDLNSEIASRLLAEMRVQFGQEAQDPVILKRFFDEIEKVKLMLASRSSYDFEMLISEKGGRFSKALSRYEYREWIRAPLQKITDLCREALEESGVGGSLQEVLLAGGASRGLLFQEAVKDAFQKPFSTDVNPEFSGVYGTALRAEMLAGGIKPLRIVE